MVRAAAPETSQGTASHCIRGNTTSFSEGVSLAQAANDELAEGARKLRSEGLVLAERVRRLTDQCVIQCS